MKNKLIGLITVAVIIMSVSTFMFLNKTYLDFELICSLNEKRTEFNPNAYVVFHTQKQLDSFFEMNSNTTYLKTQLPSELIFDFKNYSYCIVYGKQVKNMCYSYKTTLFDDISPSYASCWKYRKKCVFIEYDTNKTGKGTYLYKLKHDSKLRGFDGL
jgi:hypothetical protein